MTRIGPLNACPAPCRLCSGPCPGYGTRSSCPPLIVLAVASASARFSVGANR